MLKGQGQSHIRFFSLIFKNTPAGPPVGQANIMSILFKKPLSVRGGNFGTTIVKVIMPGCRIVPDFVIPLIIYSYYSFTSTCICRRS
jgi:hypothetical protein